jgi:carboxyl-terminal processing protease
MRRFQTKSFFRRSAIAAVASVLLAVVFVFSKTLPIVTPSQLESDETSTAFDPEFANFLKENGYGSGDLSKTLFMDSILSIIQNYYVEPTRAANQDLVYGVATVLSDEIPDFHLVTRDNQKFLEISGESPVPVPSEAGYLDLLKFVFLVSKKLEAYQKRHPGEFDSADAPENLVLNALLRGLDAHSSILNREAYRDLRQGTEGSFGGLGVLVGMRSNILTVVKPIRNSPAERAGLKKSDKIIAINGTRTFGQSLEELVGFMRGEPGTTVKMRILRDSQSAPIDYELKREIIQVESVRTEFVRRGQAKIAFMAIETFSNRTAEEVHQALKTARDQFGGKMHGLILDLRSNPGGLLDQAVQVADLFLKDGVIVSTEGRRNEVERAGKGYHEDDYLIALLIDGDTASASEIVAGALQDHDRAIVIGQRSFGKGSVQTIFELPGERALKLTVARYFTPLHRSIQGSGIVPDLLLSPVYPKDRNVNLLGSGKYRTEGMLRNSLRKLSDDGVTAHSTSILESIYLNESVEEQDPQAGEMENDFLRSVAESLITSVARTYPNGIPAGARRSDHWLALALPGLKQELVNASDRASKFLNEKFGVDWTADGLSHPGATIVLDLPESRFEVSSAPGGVSIPVKMRLQGSKQSVAQRVSLLFKPRMEPLFETEILVGRLKSGEEKSVTLNINVPAFEGASRITGSIYPVIDGQIQFEGARKIVIEAKSNRKPGILPEVAFEDGERSIAENSLDPGERGFVRVKIHNNSPTPLSKLRIELSNLAGSQIKLTEPRHEIHQLDKDQVYEFRFPVEASNSIVSDQVEIGVTVGSEDSGDLYRKSFVYRATQATGKSDQAH